ncbi:MAG: hypothetical protein K9J06_11090 [Flavobacteriales bacterium]|nr:hypothetical protein [Flavobacteriales bacterium]
MVSPYQLLVTLEVSPKDGMAVNDVLAKVHPVLRELGYVDFQKNDDGLITAEDNEGHWAMQTFMFVEQREDAIHFNVDGTFYFFNPDAQQKRLKKVKDAMEKAMPCEATVSSADYPRVFLSAMFFTVGPALAGIIVAMLLGEVMTGFWPLEGSVHRDVLSMVKYAIFGLFASGTVWRKFRRKGLSASQGFGRLALGYFAVFGLLYLLAFLMNMS